MTKSWVIGDIHGGLKALKQILEKAPIGPDDKLIFLGDYVDGWSESGQVVDYLIELEKKQPCVFIRGNHDVLCHDFLSGKEMDASWNFHGGEATVACYKDGTFDVAKHVEFLDRLQNYYVDEENRLFIHAGFSSMRGVEKEEYESNFYWDRTLWETALAFNPALKKDDLRYPKRFNLYHEIFIGHTYVLRYGTDQPINSINLWNLDTGVAYYGRLTIMDVDTKQLWQSDPVNELYPDEIGRNTTTFNQQFD